MPYMRYCVVCGKEFVARNPLQLTCSSECSAERSKAVQRQYDKEHRREARKKPVAKEEPPKRTIEKQISNPIQRRLAQGKTPHATCDKCIYWRPLSYHSDTVLNSSKLCYYALTNPTCRKMSKDKIRCLSFLPKGDKQNGSTEDRNSTDSAE